MSDISAEVDQLRMELMETGKLWPETIDDLDRILSEATSQTLSDGDLSYIRALHKRLIGASDVDGPSESSNKDDDDDPPETSDEHTDWRERAHSAMSRAKAAEKSLKEISSSSNPEVGQGGDQKFEEIKRRFAKLYHPDNTSYTGLEATIRGEIFKEFWKEIEEVESD